MVASQVLWGMYDVGHAVIAKRKLCDCAVTGRQTSCQMSLLRSPHKLKANIAEITKKGPFNCYVMQREVGVYGTAQITFNCYVMQREVGVYGTAQITLNCYVMQ